jgi:Tat protein secretion system quality control protein TatD with DNase activity
MTARNVSAKTLVRSQFCIGTSSFDTKTASYETHASLAKSVQPNNLLIETTCKRLQYQSFPA